MDSESSVSGGYGDVSALSAIDDQMSELRRNALYGDHVADRQSYGGARVFKVLHYHATLRETDLTRTTAP